MRKFALVAVAVMVVFAGCSGFGGGGTATPEATETPTTTPADGTATPDDGTETPTDDDSAPADPDEDVLGWENGVWYNESLDVDASDGFTDEELDQLKYRTMARLEQIRELEFQEDVPVQIQTREEYQQELEESGAFDASANSRIHQNVKWRATFMVDQNTDAIEELRAFFGGAVLGFYDPEADEIVVISPSDEEGVPSGLDEMTLAHELAHALQDQTFNISQSKFQGATTEEDNAVSGIVEGDAHYMEYLYQQRCESGEWECLEQPDTGGGGGEFNIGLWSVQYTPYSEGPTLIQTIREQEGWEGVNAMYENPPASTAQLIHHDKYPDETPVDVTVEDRSNDEWAIPEIEDGVDHVSFGEAGLYAMFWYPSYVESQAAGAPQNVVIPYQDFFNFDQSGNLAGIGPYDYSHAITEGWQGDKLYPYVNDAGDTGFVWKLQWASEGDAQEFVAAYGDLLAYHGAEEVDSNTYRIPDGESFAGAYTIIQDGNTVVIVNAPSVDQLGDVREGAGS